MDEEYVEAVLALVERVPRGRVTTYGALADAVAARLGRGGPRTVAWVLATHGAAVPWWRVVTAAGRVPPRHEVAALSALAGEGAPLTAAGRVDLRLAAWQPATAPADQDGVAASDPVGGT